MSEKSKAVGSFLVEEAKKWFARTTIMFVVGFAVLLFTPISDRVLRIWHSPDLLQEVLDKLDRLSIEVNKATGEDKVILEVAGQSYVREPVVLGDKITLNMVVRRTSLGASCTLVNRTAIFTDETGIASAGETLRPARQLGTSESMVRLMLDVPAQVVIGRVTVYLSLEFDCDGKRVFNQTRPVAFMLLNPPT